MRRPFFNESCRLIYLAIFKPLTLATETEQLTRKDAVLMVLKLLPGTSALLIAIIAIAGIFRQLVGYPFDRASYLSAVIALLLGFGLAAGLGFGLAVEWVGRLFFGLAAGLGFGLVGRPVNDPGNGRMVVLGYGLLAGLLARLLAPQADGLNAGLTAGLVCLISYAFTFYRPFYLPIYIWQYWKANQAADPFKSFHHSPVYWDEVIAMPLPYLVNWLIRCVHHDRERGLAEIRFVTAQRPFQRRAAQKALIALAVEDLQRMESLDDLAKSAQVLAFLPTDAEYAPDGLSDARRHVEAVSQLARDYQTRITPVGRLQLLEELRQELQAFRDGMTLVKRPVGQSLQPLALCWLSLVDKEATACRETLAFTPIPNPYIVGNLLQYRDDNLFKGRKDIIVAIEENIINPSQRPALLLYGRRRIGKTSTLLHLPRLLSSQFIPIFIDFQDARWRESDAVFGYQLARSIVSEVNKREAGKGLADPRLESFERYPFTVLAETLDALEDWSRQMRKQLLLTFDEYEKLEEGLRAGKITTEILNLIRYIVQHREQIVVLFSGSHRFEEAQSVNWADYLINVKMIELSFLAPDDARELITQPVPNLQYASHVDDAIIQLTHGQPYLLQAMASELVNDLNAQKRLVATPDDLDVAIEKVLVTAQAYFFFTWQEDCSEAEREMLRTMAAHGTTELARTPHQETLQALCRKDMLQYTEGRYHFTIELFRRWVVKTQMVDSSSDMVTHSGHKP